MNKIERLSLKLKPQFNAAELGKLSESQLLYLDCFRKGLTIAHTVEQMLTQGRLVSFTQLFDLVQRLTDKNIIQNMMFRAYFNKLHECQTPKEVSPLKGLVSQLFKHEKAEDYLKRHPFFRSQNPLVTQLFCSHAQVVDCKAGTVLCQSGHLERDLFFVIDGEAGIYKNTEDGHRRLLGFFGKDAVIGEVGFFMGELRTADVVCTKPTKVVVIRYDERAFGRMINKDIAKSLQVRFRVVHALAKSPFLKNLPEEAMDALVFAGKIRSVHEFDVVAQEGAHGDSCFIVINGSVVVSKGMKNINALGPGDAFGEIALFFTQGQRTATVMAQRDTTLLEIQAWDFYRLLGENLLLACEFEKMALQRVDKLRATA